MASACLDDRADDLFLSDAHDGNLGPAPWVEAFHDRLKAELASRIDPVSIVLSDRWRRVINAAIDRGALALQAVGADRDAAGQHAGRR